jgi:hypothetical protein
MPTPLPWSHSSINAADTCPRQYEAQKVLKLFKQMKNEASIWGDEMHQAAESYLKAGGKEPLPERFASYKTYLDKYLAMPGTLLAEQEYAINKKLEPTGFYDVDVWGRGIIDVLILNGGLAKVYDHKTGKRKKDMQQLIIFALLVFYHHPEIMQCDVSFEWVATNERDSEIFHRSDINTMWAAILPKLQNYASYFHQGIFPPKPSGLCRAHCPVNTCEYWSVGAYRR